MEGNRFSAAKVLHELYIWYRFNKYIHVILKYELESNLRLAAIDSTKVKAKSQFKPIKTNN